MSMYGDDHRGYCKENLYSEIEDFVKEYGFAELMRIVADVVDNLNIKVDD